jgi:hypothetical protein
MLQFYIVPLHRESVDSLYRHTVMPSSINLDAVSMASPKERVAISLQRSGIRLPVVGRSLQKMT